MLLFCNNYQNNAACKIDNEEIERFFLADSHTFFWLLKSEPNIWSIEQQRKARAKWPLDSSAPFLKGPGLKL